MDLAVILVHYHTPELVGPAVEAVRADLATSGLSVDNAELLLVDNGSQPGAREHFEALGLRYLNQGENLGYAGGVNLGVESTQARRLVVMNPDVLVQPGCLGALLEQLDLGKAAAGPCFYWDEGCSILLPPTEPRNHGWELRAALAPRAPFWAKVARGHWRRHARTYWSAHEPITAYDLSGALIAFHRSAWEHVGPFDTGYQLYFEETDWLQRLRRAGLPVVYVPSAQAIHLYNRSAAREPRAAAWFAEARERFFRRTYGGWFFRLVRSIETLSQPVAELVPDLVPEGQPPALTLGHLRPAPAWIEISPASTGFPAAAERLQQLDDKPAQFWSLPQEIWQRLDPGRYRLQAVSCDGQEVARFRFRKPDSPSATAPAFSITTDEAMP